jgi:uncharacterized repeat protein (TIGR01451 family)
LRDTEEIPPEMPAIKELTTHPRPRRPGPKGFVDPVLQTSVAGPEMPAPVGSFEGVNNVNGVMPPDPVGAAGPDHYVQWVNLSFAIFDKATGTKIYGPASGNTLWQALGGPCAGTNNGDPVVLYDHLAGRWFFSQFALPNYPSGGPFYQCIAVSQTSDPTGAYHLYMFKISDTKLNDYPKFGVWPDAYYMATNQFTCSSGCSWSGQGVVAFDRASMLDGLPADMIYFDLETVDSTLGGMLPSDLNGPPPAANTPNFFVQFDDDAWGYSPDQLQVWAFHVDWGTPTSSSFTKQGALTTAAFDSNLCNYSACITQRGTTRRVDSLSDRLMYRLQYRNFGSYATLVTNHTVDVDGTNHAGIRWYELRNGGGGWSIHQQGTFAPDANHRWMGSMAMDAAGNIALGYSVSSSTTFPSIRYTGRLAGDPLGTLPQGETTLMSGTGSQTSTSGRWGDYSTMAVDPVDDCTFWYTQEYYALTGASNWRTRFGSFRFASCGPSPSGADLGIDSVGVPDPVAQGGDVTYTLTIGNDGPDAATNVTVQDTVGAGATLKSVAASQGSCATGSPISCALGELGPGSTATVTIVVTATATGSTSNSASVSADQSDPNPGNNAATTSVTVTTALADLVETAVSDPPPAALPGKSFSVTDTTENHGAGSAGSFKVRYYLSSDTTKSTGDKLLAGARSVSSLAGGGSSTGSATVTIPASTALGTYHLIACADDIKVVPEADETNNCLASTGTVQVTRPDLVEASVGNPPAISGPGKTISVTDTAKNQGLVGAAASRVRYYLSVDQTKSTGDRLLTGARLVPPLGAGATSTGSTTVTIPAITPLGTYYLLACADDTKVVVETDEANNCSASPSPITLIP